ncbi:hypothetical protein VTN02DRAFT_6688 [Thermoascus thermophilus]
MADPAQGIAFYDVAHSSWKPHVKKTGRHRRAADLRKPQMIHGADQLTEDGTDDDDDDELQAGLSRVEGEALFTATGISTTRAMSA